MGYEHVLDPNLLIQGSVLMKVGKGIISGRYVWLVST